MSLKIFTIYDSKAEFYMQPMFFKSKGEFLRAFIESVNDSKSNLGKYPGDFTAFELGMWDEHTSSFVLHKAPVSLGVGVEFVRESSKLPLQET